MADQNERKLTYFIMQHLHSHALKLKEEDAESLQVAIQCIGETCGVDLEADRDALATKGASLQQIFNVYLSMQSSKAPAASDKKNASADVKVAGEEDKKEAEACKARGNKLLVSKDLSGSIKEYTRAIELDSTNAVYYSNRAAAYSQQSEHELAVLDCETALKLDATYAKAYSRMGLAKYSLSEFEGAAKAFEQCLELDPENASAKKSLAAARQKLDMIEQQQRGVNSMASGGGLPAGMPDISSLMQNPAMMQMAQEMMSNPEMASLFSGMAGGAGGGAAPNLADMLKNPQMRAMADKMAKNPDAMNALKGAMGDPATSISKKGGKK